MMVMFIYNLYSMSLWWVPAENPVRFVDTSVLFNVFRSIKIKFQTSSSLQVISTQSLNEQSIKQTFLWGTFVVITPFSSFKL